MAWAASTIGRLLVLAFNDRAEGERESLAISQASVFTPAELARLLT
jgi:hypothetical protein